MAGLSTPSCPDIADIAAGSGTTAIFKDVRLLLACLFMLLDQNWKLLGQWAVFKEDCLLFVCLLIPFRSKLEAVGTRDDSTEY